VGGFLQSPPPILDSDIIHIRHPDGRDYGGILHVFPFIEEKGLLILYNPLSVPIKKEIRINLYYTGLENKARISESNEKDFELQIDRCYNALLSVNIPALEWNWYIIK